MSEEMKSQNSGTDYGARRGTTTSSTVKSHLIESPAVTETLNQSEKLPYDSDKSVWKALAIVCLVIAIVALFYYVEAVHSFDPADDVICIAIMSVSGGLIPFSILMHYLHGIREEQRDTNAMLSRIVKHIK